MMLRVRARASRRSVGDIRTNVSKHILRIGDGGASSGTVRETGSSETEGCTDTTEERFARRLEEAVERSMNDLDVERMLPEGMRPGATPEWPARDAPEHRRAGDPGPPDPPSMSSRLKRAEQ
jgi:hypothetical protein